MVSPLLPPPKRRPGVGEALFPPCTSASTIAPPAEPVAVSELVLVFPSNQIVLLPVGSVIPRFPALSALPAPAEMMFQVCPPLLVFASANHVPKLFAVPTDSGV